MGHDVEPARISEPLKRVAVFEREGGDCPSRHRYVVIALGTPPYCRASVLNVKTGQPVVLPSDRVTGMSRQEALDRAIACLPSLHPDLRMRVELPYSARV